MTADNQRNPLLRFDGQGFAVRWDQADIFRGHSIRIDRSKIFDFVLI